ncbi:MAG: GNAT family N-acetyltransferase [Mycobacterium sp.]
MIRESSVQEIRERGAALIAAAAEDTGSDGDVQWYALEHLANAGLLVVLVIEVDGELVGHCACAFGPDFWSSSPSLTTVSIFVQPEHRPAWGMQLLRRLVQEARERGAVARVQVNPDTQAHRLVSALSGRPGFKARAVAMTYELG